MKLISGLTLVETYFACADYVVDSGVRKSDMEEVQNLLCSINLLESDVRSFRDFVSSLSRVPELQYGFEKAKRAYGRLSGNITKPSYKGRLLSFPFLKVGSNDQTPLDQLTIVAEKFAEAPQASNLSMTVFHPSDLKDAYRPGYVPCLSFIDIKFRDGVLETKFFFRSCDFAEVAIFDFYHTLELHCEIRGRFSDLRPDIEFKAENLTLFFSRAFTYNRKRDPIDLIKRAAAAA